jgi:hypothetical protein
LKLGFSRRNPDRIGFKTIEKLRFLSSATTFASEADNEELWVKSPFPSLEYPIGVTVPEFLKSTMGPWGTETAYVRRK